MNIPELRGLGSREKELQGLVGAWFACGVFKILYLFFCLSDIPDPYVVALDSIVQLNKGLRSLYYAFALFSLAVC